MITEYLHHLQHNRSKSMHQGASYTLAALPGVTQDDLLRWYAELGESPAKATTKNFKLAIVQAFVRWAQDRGELQDVNLRPLKRFKRLDGESTPTPQVLAREDIKRLVLACRDMPCGSITLAALLTGARRNELHTFRPRQVGDDGVIAIIGRKTRSERLVDPKYLGTGVELFYRAKNANRAPFRWSRETWNALRRSAGLPRLLFKTLRSTWSSYLKSGGVNDWLVDKMAGHTAAVADKHYDRLVPGVTGDTLPVMYGCEPEFTEAVKVVKWP